MKITSIKQATCHIVETDGEHNDNFFIRHSADNWSVRMGESDESLWLSDEMEEEFQKCLNHQMWEQMLKKLGFTLKYWDELSGPEISIVTSRYEKDKLVVIYEVGHYSLNIGDTFVAIFQDPFEFETFVELMERRFE